MSAEQAPQKLLHGSRQEGVVPLPSGAVEVHEVSGDGMKQTRIVGNGTAKDYHEFQDRVAAEATRAQAAREATARAVADPEYTKQFMPPAEQ